MDRWVRLIEEATLETTADVKSLFGSSVDFVEGRTIFDVGGNKYRVVRMFDYPMKLVTVIFVGTHAQYDKGDWKK
ncbi:MAG: type II toxin-antitoxin system HigB family toxin [Deltaproteobacteria bacterium]|nr:type II toxin-antitoxin system HigB family toxin [Deltaproteobacteria bacterium]